MRRSSSAPRGNSVPAGGTRHDRCGVHPGRCSLFRGVVSQRARTRDESLDATALAAIAGRPGSFVIFGPRQRDCGPTRRRWHWALSARAPSTTTPPPQPGADDHAENRRVVRRLRRRLPPTGRSNWRRWRGALDGRAQPRGLARVGRPFSQVEFAFFTRPVAGEIAPGMPMPTVRNALRSDRPLRRCPQSRQSYRRSRPLAWIAARETGSCRPRRERCPRFWFRQDRLRCAWSNDESACATPRPDDSDRHVRERARSLR